MNRFTLARYNEMRVMLYTAYIMDLWLYEVA